MSVVSPQATSASLAQEKKRTRCSHNWNRRPLQTQPQVWPVGLGIGPAEGSALSALREQPSVTMCDPPPPPPPSLPSM